MYNGVHMGALFNRKTHRTVETFVCDNLAS